MSTQVVNTQGNIPSTYSKREINMIIITTVLGWSLEFFDLQILSMYAPGIMASFQISKATFGAIASVQLLFTAIGGIIFGMLADKYGRKRMLTWTILLFSISTFFMIFAWNVGTVYVLRALTGLGVGGEWAIGFSLLNEAWNPKRRGLMGGIVQSSIWPAYALAVFVSQVMPDWRGGFAVGVLPAIVALLVRFYVPESKVWSEYNKLKLAGKLPPELMKSAKRSTLVQIFQKDIIKFTVLGSIIVFGAQYAYYAMSAWLPTLLVQVYNFTTSSKSNFLYLGSAVAFLSYMTAGGLSDKFGRKKTFMVFAVILLFGYGMFAYVNLVMQNIPLLALSYILINIGNGLYGIFGVWFAEIFPTRVRATGSSFAYNVGRGVASGGPLIVGVVATTSNLLLGVSTGVIAILIMIVAVPFMTEKKGREITSVE